LPDGLNVFSWSLPFLADKVSSMLYTIVKKCSNFDDEPDEKEALNKLESDQAEQSRKAKNVIKGKIKSVAAMSRMFNTLREEHEMILKIKNISPDGKLPRGILLDGKPAIKHAAKQFNIAQELDRENEKRPRKKN
jgi:serine/threonine-protein phosphatase 2B catalytic subunit